MNRSDDGRAPTLTVVVDERTVAVPAGATVLDACRAAGVEIPTLCFLQTFAPVNVCRLCVVEIEGARTLAPACSRPVEADMRVHTDSPRVRTSRRAVLELLASAVDLSAAGPEMAVWIDRYGASPTRFGGPAVGAATVEQPVKIDNELYVRDYGRCVLCYRCVQACGDQAQFTFALAVAGRGFDAHIATEFDVSLPASACVFCGNCVGVCPTGALMFKREYDMRHAGTWAPAGQSVTATICPYCGVGCTLELHVQDNRIVKVTSPLDNGTTQGHLCIKGRFGYTFIEEA